MLDRKAIREMLLGRNLPVTLEVALELLDDARQWVLDRINDPARREREVRERGEEIRQQRARDRSDATGRVVRLGRMLLQLRAVNGRTGWGQVLLSIGISYRTASNYVALALFAHRAPDLYEKLKVLGPTKLYRIARLGDAAIKELRIDMEIPLEGGPVKLRYLTDRELGAWLRAVCPPETRRHWPRVRTSLFMCHRLIERAPRDEPVSSIDLDLMRDIARNVVARLTGVSSRAG